jgi:hypothetical protein
MLGLWLPDSINVLFSYTNEQFLCTCRRLWEFWLKWAELPALASSVSLIFRRFNWTAWSPQTHDWSRTFPLYQAIKIGCAVFATFFYSLRSESKRIWILFAWIGISANTIYSHHSLHIRFKIFSKFEFKYSICCKTNTFSRTGEYLLQNIRFEANIRKTLCKFHIQANIRLQIYSYKRILSCKYSRPGKFLLFIASNNQGKPFTILGLN